MQDCLYLGNLDARRDWGHAKDYVQAHWQILQQAQPDDYVIATGEQHSVREFVQVAAEGLGIHVSWRGSGTQEVGIDDSSGRIIVRVDPRYHRPTEVDSLLGDASKARRILSWSPTISFRQLVSEMVEADVALVRRDQAIAHTGFKICSPHE
jgi:GDPmannose 4,6-dehydratase